MLLTVEEVPTWGLWHRDDEISRIIRVIKSEEGIDLHCRLIYLVKVGIHSFGSYDDIVWIYKNIIQTNKRTLHKSHKD